MKFIAMPTGSHIRADQITAVRLAEKAGTILDRVIVDFSGGLHEICYCESWQDAADLADRIALDIAAATALEGKRVTRVDRYTASVPACNGDELGSVRLA